MGERRSQGVKGWTFTDTAAIRFGESSAEIPRLSPESRIGLLESKPKPTRDESGVATLSEALDWMDDADHGCKDGPAVGRKPAEQRAAESARAKKRREDLRANNEREVAKRKRDNRRASRRSERLRAANHAAEREAQERAAAKERAAKRRAGQRAAAKHAADQEARAAAKAAEWAAAERAAGKKARESADERQRRRIARRAAAKLLAEERACALFEAEQETMARARAAAVTRAEARRDKRRDKRRLQAHGGKDSALQACLRSKTLDELLAPSNEGVSIRPRPTLSDVLDGSDDDGFVFIEPSSAERTALPKTKPNRPTIVAPRKSRRKRWA